MKKTYEKPVLTTEQFDVDDVITASAPDAQLGMSNSNNHWEVLDIPTGDVQFH